MRALSALAVLALAGCDWNGAFQRYCDRSGACDAGTAGGGGAAGGGDAGGAGGGSGGSGGSGGAGGTGGSGGGAPCTEPCPTDGGCAIACGQLCRHPGSACANPDCIGVPPSPAGFPTRIWGTTTHDFWVSQNAGRVFHYNDAGWGCLDTSAISANHALWASGQEVWVGGSGGMLLHWQPGLAKPEKVRVDVGQWRGIWSEGDGGVWIASAEGIRRRAEDGGFEPRAGTTGNPTWLHGQATPAGTLVVMAATNGVLGYDFGAGWREEVASTQDFAAVYVERDGRAWAAEGPTDGGLPGIYTKLTGGGWKPEAPLGGPRDLASALTGANGIPYLALDREGPGGAVLRRDPILGWQSMTKTDMRPYSVWAAPNDDLLTAHAGLEVRRTRQRVCPYPTAPIRDSFTEVLALGWGRLGDAGVVNDQLALVPGSALGFTGVYAQGIDFDLAGTSISVQLVSPAVGSTQPRFTLGEFDELGFDVVNGAFALRVGDGGVFMEVDAGFSAGSYLRLREQAGEVLFEMSPNAADAGWVRLHQIAAPEMVRHVPRVALFVRQTGTDPAPTVFDNLDVCP